MLQLLFYLKNNKFQSLWIIISSLLINLLALSSALYVIQVFNRYLSYQINSTLIALTLGVLMAFSIELVLRIIRSFLVNKITIINFRQEALKKINILTSLKINTNRTKSLLDEINPLNHVDINKAEILIGFIDVFFVIIFLGVIFILSFNLGVLSFIITVSFTLVLYLKSKINFLLNTKTYKIIRHAKYIAIE